MGAQTDLLINALQQGNELNAKVEELQAELTSAKEEIGRLKAECEELKKPMGIDWLVQQLRDVLKWKDRKLAEQETLLASERKETERLRETLRWIEAHSLTSHQVKARAKAALQSRQGEGPPQKTIQMVCKAPHDCRCNLECRYCDHSKPERQGEE